MLSWAEGALYGAGGGLVVVTFGRLHAWQQARHAARVATEALPQLGTYIDPPADSLAALFPNNIVAGPDEALWFTDRRSIGRIDTDGDLSHFPVRASKYPSDIPLGPDKALWFTTDRRVGRITTKGRIALWPVRGAKELAGIVPVPDGSVWLADRGTDTVRRFTPPR
ncbi:hypothetical protein DDE74_00385 [Streptomyces lydicus]|uniref:SMP-30/Gluconolactonase/LRE-like region domain-containing protein n=1 Tax=Streptomyces lydicus TaxID=47763 RepID=A0A3S9Y3R1_9ACTN|nr:hypothetical protein [Streptomyces lydicus]AZS69645.1 hypothetical protein DDE74_00385 [Streptomyces lydicus]